MCRPAVAFRWESAVSRAGVDSLGFERSQPGSAPEEEAGQVPDASGSAVLELEPGPPVASGFEP
jgi:hypothetical protein